jgi:hypothetical protein
MKKIGAKYETKKKKLKLLFLLMVAQAVEKQQVVA